MAIFHHLASQPDPIESFGHPVTREGGEGEYRPGRSERAEAEAVEAAPGHSLPPLSDVDIPSTSLAERIRARHESRD